MLLCFMTAKYVLQGTVRFVRTVLQDRTHAWNRNSKDTENNSNTR